MLSKSTAISLVVHSICNVWNKVSDDGHYVYFLSIVSKFYCDAII